MSDVKNCIYKTRFASSARAGGGASIFKLNIPRMELLDEGINILTGPNGAGKTTLALVLCGLKKPEPNFQWIFKGCNLAALPPAQRGISFLFQSGGLFLNMTALQNILFPLQAKAKPFWRQFFLPPKNTYQKRLARLNRTLHLDSFLNKPVHVLSGGEKQRTALARALILPPRFLILDEPFSFLDSSLKQGVFELLHHITAQEKTPMLLITHEALDSRLKGRLFYMQHGRLERPLAKGS